MRAPARLLALLALLGPSAALALDPGKTPPITAKSVTTNSIVIQGKGSAGDASEMSVAPDAFALDGTLASFLGRTGGASPNLWVNPDGALGDGSPKVVYNDGLSIYGPDRWIFQQVTLTPYVTGLRSKAADGSTAIRMLNGYAASGSLAITTGTKTLTVASGLNFVAGFPVKAVVASDPAKGMSGTIVSYSGTTLVLNITSVTGNGTFTNWVVGAVGTTKQGQTKLLTTVASAAGSTILTFADTTSVQVGANVEFAFDASFNSINGIQRGTYVVSKTATTVKLSQPTVSPAGATGGAAVVSNQRVTFYGNQGNYLFQDVQVADAVGFRYGTLEARDAWLSFDVNSFGLPDCKASMMMLGYKSISELGRSYVQSFPVTSTKTRVSFRIKGDKIGAPGTWKAGYDANDWGGLWGTVGFAWESQGTPTAQNIPDGEWSNVFAVGGSENQTCDLTGTVGAWVDVSNVKLELDKPTPYLPPTSVAYLAPRFEVKAPRTPRMVWNATRNPADLRKWQSYVLGQGSLGFGRLTDVESSETFALRLYPTGAIGFPAYPAGSLSVDANGVVGSTPNGAFTAYTPTVSASAGSPQPTFGTVTGRYKVDGKRVFIQMSILVLNNQSGAGQIIAQLPSGLPSNGFEWSLTGFDTGFTGNPVFGRLPPNSNVVQIKLINGAYPAQSGSILNLSGVYETP
ncbi:hypothetical protein [Methylorubrum extorquens]|uniref:hypothetical protein n=1 Tax=Methylorubrum extorquens TaxID=408 RepID=UPI001EE615DB|nr:hypothetical protein [Methylorubrum extorquens]MCG5245309.1 hypothetical protein [Methylorubrum extorquens]